MLDHWTLTKYAYLATSEAGATPHHHLAWVPSHTFSSSPASCRSRRRTNKVALRRGSYTSAVSLHPHTSGLSAINPALCAVPSGRRRGSCRSSTTVKAASSGGAVVDQEQVALPEYSMSEYDSAGDNTQPTIHPPHQEEEIEAFATLPASVSGPTVWSEFAALAAETGAINLGQGFPNWQPPRFVVEAAHRALNDGFHQYTRTAGHPRLAEALAMRYTRHFRREIDPYTQVAITVGASQALYVTMQTILRPGDEVLLLEPFFDLYVGQIRMAGGVPTHVPLEPRGGEWTLDMDRLRRAVTPRTRAIVINTPHNPTGKVFTLTELEGIAEVVRSNPQLLVISDEVYKYMVHAQGEAGANGEGKVINGHGHLGEAVSGGAPALGEGMKGRIAVRGRVGQVAEPVRHIHFATLPGMWDRTITISSSGKTFSVTGWQVGWVLGPKPVIQRIQTALPYMQFCVSTPMQEAICTALAKADLPYEGFPNYYEWMRSQFARRHDKLAAALTEAGIKPMKGEGGFFLIGDITGIEVPERYLKEGTPAMPNMTRDWAFCRWMALEHGLIAIPTSAFYSPENRHVAGDYVRFCFCKTDETLDAAAEALRRMHAVTRPSVEQ